jgi:hypothetical protein
MNRFYASKDFIKKREGLEPLGLTLSNKFLSRREKLYYSDLAHTQ